jgi:hypothetical protein
MKLELEIYSALCAASKFVINGVLADSNDFGWQGDQDDDPPDYCCGNMQFEGKEATEEILNKYGINKAEYALIVGQLEKGLSFGSCGWCE